MGKRLFLKSALVSRLGSLKGCSWGEAPAWLKLTSKLGKFRHLLVTWPVQAIIQHCTPPVQKSGHIGFGPRRGPGRQNEGVLPAMVMWGVARANMHIGQLSFDSPGR